jgi:hypothetical protein
VGAGSARRLDGAVPPCRGVVRVRRRCALDTARLHFSEGSHFSDRFSRPGAYASSRHGSAKPRTGNFRSPVCPAVRNETFTVRNRSGST